VVVYFWTATNRRLRGVLWSIIAPPFIDDFETFIDTRRKLMIDLVSKAMGKPVLVTGEAVPDDDVEEI
jgi:hypothetical protein